MGHLKKHPHGHPVWFTNPTTEKPEQGRIIAEVWPRDPNSFGEIAPPNNGWREGAFVAQLIEWPDKYRSVRITYYVRPEGGGPDSWTFGGQYAADMSLADCEALIRGLAETRWWEQTDAASATHSE